MAGIDIFSDNAFSLIELTAALADVEYQPQMLGSMGIFTSRSVRTEKVSIERKETVLSLVQTSPRGAPPRPAEQQPKRNIRDFRTSRLAKADHIEASELANIRAFGTESEFVQVQAEVMERMVNIRNDLELTHEHMRLGAIQGIVVDADGSVIYNWFDEWGIPQPAEMTFNFADLVGGKFREKCNQIIRQMQRAAKGAWGPGTRIGALCGDEFYDALIKNAEVREIWLAQQARADALRGDLVQPWMEVEFGGIRWINYRGTDDNSKVAIPSTKVKFFPIGAPEAFLRVQSPGEFFDTINQPGQEYYALTIPDEKRNAFVDVEVYSYPLYVATRPQMLLRGKL